MRHCCRCCFAWPIIVIRYSCPSQLTLLHGLRVACELARKSAAKGSHTRFTRQGALKTWPATPLTVIAQSRRCSGVDVVAGMQSGTQEQQERLEAEGGAGLVPLERHALHADQSLGCAGDSAPSGMQPERFAVVPEPRAMQAGALAVAPQPTGGPPDGKQPRVALRRWRPSVRTPCGAAGSFSSCAGAQGAMCRGLAVGSNVCMWRGPRTIPGACTGWILGWPCTDTHLQHCKCWVYSFLCFNTPIGKLWSTHQ